MLSWLIFIIHLLIVIFTLSIPFINFENSNVQYKSILFLHIIWCLTLLIHWYFNNDTCGLSWLEQLITKKDMSKGFIYNIISPVYKITSNEIKIITIILMFISIYKIQK